MVRSLLAIFVCLSGMQAQLRPAEPRERPKLILLIAVDQFRYDYLTRFHGQYTGGFRVLLERGADFVNANLEHYPAVTAAGHATMLSGATLATSGIVGNDWFDRDSGKQVTSVSDDTVKLLGGAGGSGSSPRRLLVSTVGDELKRAGYRSSKVIGISMKDRAAILPVGRMANGAYWYDERTGEFVSSTYYFPELPGWVKKFNDEKQADAFAGKVWSPVTGTNSGHRLPGVPGPSLYTAVYESTFGDDLLEQFTERVIEAERLGQRGATDLMSVSFSSNDAIGHSYGPDSPEVEAVSIVTDRAIGRLLAFVDTAVSLKSVTVILTADHGVAPVPEVLAEEKMPGGRVTGDFFGPIQKALEARYGPGRWLLSTAGTEPYFNDALIREKKLDPTEVENVAARAIASVPYVARVYTRGQLVTGRPAADNFDRRVIRSFNLHRSGDLEIVLDPYWIRGSTAATHGTPYNYDTHIPLVFMGPGIRPGRYYEAAALNDIAPTLAALLDLEIPSASVGRILSEMFENRP
jgi:predicted AlkP superfamily pyrophosphatase or phosphodiesterase